MIWVYPQQPASDLKYFIFSILTWEEAGGSNLGGAQIYCVSWFWHGLNLKNIQNWPVNNDPNLTNSANPSAILSTLSQIVNHWLGGTLLVNECWFLDPEPPP